MLKFSYLLLLIFPVILLSACKKQKDNPPVTDKFQLTEIKAGNRTMNQAAVLEDVDVNSNFYLNFTTAIDSLSATEALKIVSKASNQQVSFTISLENGNKTVVIKPNEPLQWLTAYELAITNQLKDAAGAGFDGAQFDFTTENGKLKLTAASINGISMMDNTVLKNIKFDSIHIELQFNEAIDTANIAASFKTIPYRPLQINTTADDTKVIIKNISAFDYYSKYIFIISATLNSATGFDFEGFDISFISGLDPSYKMPPLTDEELLDEVQLKTFRYFWDHAHPVSGLARERLNSGETVTIGGSGFGVMAILAGIERGFISRSDGVSRLSTITNFLAEADRFHGVWPHWMNGSTGRTIAFSNMDDGGDLVETSFMAAGLIAARQYLHAANNTELAVINTINALLQSIEWSWYTRDGQNRLYWHWSPNNGWAMNMPIRGYNEALITYIMAASSDTYPIEAEVYHQGWAQSGAIVNGNDYYNINLPLGFAYGGPLFFAHYSFLGLNPRGLSDAYANYWTQNVNHSLINRQHCIENPNQFTGYSADCWGLTASDEPDGYGVHEPTRDNGVITPTAALSSMPYTPEESMAALRHFYFVLGDKLWGEYGFYDAFSPEEGWWSDAYLAIDQGPIVVMIENHRSNLIWDLFMSAPETQNAMNKLGFSSQNQ
ncbi:MAG: Ig-like domain-containing protein [Bacteroidetes bacterium]|jgi:hypothetical protein|nr:Ig-like domain-containing protein [Bacteroidota bacterium]